MIYLSHRGNLNGRNKKKENHPDYINKALNKKFSVEVDVWFKKSIFYLGHDRPQYKVSEKFLLKKNIWCHAKNISALSELKKIKSHYFWHQEDQYTVTSKGFIWAYPGEKLTNETICVLPEVSPKGKIKKIQKCAGICSDFIELYKL